MALRELKKDEPVLVIDGRVENLKIPIGLLAKAIYDEDDGRVVISVNNHTVRKLRKHLLCIGDKVTRGPGWENRQGNSIKAKGVGVVTGFNHPDSAEGYDVEVDWPDLKDVSCRMTPDHQDLKPVGDSVDEVGNKQVEGCEPIRVGDKVRSKSTGYEGIVTQVKSNELWYLSDSLGNAWNMPDNFELLCRGTSKETNEPKPIKEDSIMATDENRSARKRELETEVIPARVDAVAEAELSLEKANQELARLKAHKTAHAEIVADIILAKAVNAEEAEAILRLSKGVGIQV